VSEWVGECVGFNDPLDTITSHFGDESFQAVNWIALVLTEVRGQSSRSLGLHLSGTSWIRYLLSHWGIFDETCHRYSLCQWKELNRFSSSVVRVKVKVIGNSLTASKFKDFGQSCFNYCTYTDVWMLYGRGI